MDVVKDNFDEAMKLYEKSLAKCDFVTIDTELSGIQVLCVSSNIHLLYLLIQ